MFIILSGPNALLNKYILGSKIFVFIGKISYPLYLWHWPLLVYGKMFYLPGSTSIFAIPMTMVLISIILSILTYYLI